MSENTPRKRLCGKSIHRHSDRWIVEHIRALALLGDDINTNCAPAHYECALVKTHTEDLPRIRKAKRLAAPKKRKGFWKPNRSSL